MESGKLVRSADLLDESCRYDDPRPEVLCEPANNERVGRYRENIKVNDEQVSLVDEKAFTQSLSLLVSRPLDLRTPPFFPPVHAR